MLLLGVIACLQFPLAYLAHTAGELRPPCRHAVGVPAAGAELERVRVAAATPLSALVDLRAGFFVLCAARYQRRPRLRY
jgi:hypothetical protein